jgi:acetyl-CoA C-acetyltransferase
LFGLRPPLGGGIFKLVYLAAAFSAVALMTINRLKIERDKVNINGGAISIGHPVGASGGRLVATLLNGLEETGGRYGLATLCIGGGEAVAAVFERL